MSLINWDEALTQRLNYDQSSWTATISTEVWRKKKLLARNNVFFFMYKLITAFNNLKCLQWCIYALCGLLVWVSWSSSQLHQIHVDITPPLKEKVDLGSGVKVVWFTLLEVRNQILTSMDLFCIPLRTYFLSVLLTLPKYALGLQVYTGGKIPPHIIYMR